MKTQEKTTEKKKISKKKEIIKEASKKQIEQEKNNPSKKHNGIISFWKFMFCMMIVIYHANVFSKAGEKIILSKGSIGVEFFFLVSGYLMTKSALKKQNDSNYENLGKETINFIWKKYKTFVPYTIFAGLISIFLINLYGGGNLYKNITFIWDILLLIMTGLKGLSVNGPIWYISSMLLSMMILYPLIRRYKYNFLYIVAPLIILLGLGYLNRNFNNLRTPTMWIGFTYKGNIRAFIELLLGGILYIVCEKFKEINFTKFGKIFITVIEILCFITPFFISQFVTSATKYDFIVLAVISIGIIIAFSEKTLEYNFMCNKFSYWLERLSLTLYIFHFPIRLFFRNASFLKNIEYMKRLLLFIPSTIIICIIIMYLMEYLKKKNYFLNKIKNLLIEQK